MATYYFDVVGKSDIILDEDGMEAGTAQDACRQALAAIDAWTREGSPGLQGTSLQVVDGAGSVILVCPLD